MTKDQMLEIQQQNEYSGVTNWHNSGIKGKGVVVWTCEDEESDHGQTTRLRILQAAPDATVIMASYSMKYNRKEIEYEWVDYKGKRYSIEEFIKTFGIRVITKSVAGGEEKGGICSKFWNDLKTRYNLVFFNAAGNNGVDGISSCFPVDVAIMVGWAYLYNGKPKRAYQSSIGEELDFMQFAGCWNGTSFASPYLAGMAALLCEKYPSITQDEVYDYFRRHAEDLEDAGRDDNTGYGLAKMGDVNEMTREIKIKIGEASMSVDGRKVELDQPAIIDRSTGRMLVPLRAIAEALGCVVSWDNASRTVTIKG